MLRPLELPFKVSPFVLSVIGAEPCSVGLGIGVVPERTQDLPNRGFELKKVRGVDFKIGLGVACKRESRPATHDDITDIARSLVRPGR